MSRFFSEKLDGKGNCESTQGKGGGETAASKMIDSVSRTEIQMLEFGCKNREFVADV